MIRGISHRVGAVFGRRSPRSRVARWRAPVLLSLAAITGLVVSATPAAASPPAFRQVNLCRMCLA